MSNRVTLQVDGRPTGAVAGTGLAAVLMAQASAYTRISVSGQPRAPLCGMGVCHECRVDVDGSRRLACQTLVREGMQVCMGAEAPAALRDDAAQPPRSMASQASRHCDLLIVGAGPAGLAAAGAAASSGASIVVLDDNPAPGGQIWRQGTSAAAGPALSAQLHALARHTNVTLLGGARVVGLAGSRSLLVDHGDGGVVLHWHRIILCTGARELQLPFPGWTLPGVTGAGGLQALVKNGLAVAGQRVVVAGSGPLLLATAATLRAAGARVLRVAEQAAWVTMAAFAARLPRWPGKLVQSVQLLDPNWRANSWVQQAHGNDHVQSVQIRRGRHTETLECDRLACGFGLVPNTELGQMLGCAVDARGDLVVDAKQATTAPDVWAAGECTGIGGSERAGVQGRMAGLAVVGDAKAAAALGSGLGHWQAFADAVQRHFALNPAVRRLARADTLVCRCEDVPLAALQGHDGWIAAKLHTRCGMGACQGRICGAAAHALMGWTVAPPRHLLNPVDIATLAGIDAGSSVPA